MMQSEMAKVGKQIEKSFNEESGRFWLLLPLSFIRREIVT